ncbi:MAG: hypothetical protein ACRDD2_01985 [Sarcina sp.]
MINSTSYYILLFIIIIFYCLVLANTFKKAPKKIKLTFSLLLILALIKNITIIIISFLSNPVMLKLCQIIAYSDMFYIPAILIIIFYVFLRNNEFNFNHLLYAIGALAILFIGFMLWIRGRFVVYLDYGYGVDINKSIYSMVFIAIITGLLAAFLLSKKYIRTNFTGILGITLVSVIFIIENLSFFCNLNIYPYALIGELILIGLSNYAIEDIAK